MGSFIFSKRAAVLTVALALNSLVLAEAKVDEEIVGPMSDPDAKYVVSPEGCHLATVGHKGSRMMVTVDGQAGPKIDDVITPVSVFIDNRYQQRIPQEMQGHVSPQPVTFSNDGNHYAYIARVGQEWIVYEDNKEWLKIPAGGIVGGTAGIGGSEGNTDVRLQFGGDDGKHLFFAKSTYGGFELWEDGQKLPGFWQDAGNGYGSLAPIISLDGNHVAYIAKMGPRPDDKQTVIFDGKDTGYLVQDLELSPDGQHLFGIGKEGNAQVLLVDGHPLPFKAFIIRYYIPPVGGHLAIVIQVKRPNGSLAQELLARGKPVPDTICDQIQSVIFSPDGNRYAALCTRSGAQWMVVDGKKGQEYMVIDNPPATITGMTAPTFSPDSKKFGYVAQANGTKKFIVIDEDESDGYDGMAMFKWTADSKHFITYGMRNYVAIVTVDDKPQRILKSVNFDTFTYSPDFSHYAYSNSNGSSQGQIVIDGKDSGFTGLFAYSPDFQHMLINGSHPQDGKNGLFVDGKLVAPMIQAIPIATFSADSQHVYWLSIEPNTGPDKDKDAFMAAIYCDGKQVATCARSGPGLNVLFPRGYGQTVKPFPAWHPNKDGTFTLLAPTQDGFKRHKVTAPDTNLQTLAADADAKEKAKGGRH